MMPEGDGIGEIREELAACLVRLRWMLSSFQVGGVKDWISTPATPAASLPSEEEQAPAAEESSARGAGDLHQALEVLTRSLDGCNRCRLHSGRKHIVVGDGGGSSGLVFVGEGPGFDEDRQGLPFVGRAGKLLDKMIAAIGLMRSDVYICNVVKCRPPDNRTPNDDEIEACSPFLLRQLEMLRPKVICALGACAAQTLLATGSSISRLRGKAQNWRGIPVICTFHPAYLLRNPAQKASSWQDLQEVRRILLSERSIKR